MDYYIARLPAFRELPEAALSRLSDAARLRKYRRGEAVFSAGDPPGSVYLLRAGLLKAVKPAPRGRQAIMQLIGPGTLFGMIAVLDRKAYPVSAVCLHESEAYRIPTPDFSVLLERHPAFARAVYAEVGAHLRQSQALRAMAKAAVEERVAYALWTLSESLGRELRLRRGDIAELAGTSEETVIRTLGELRRRGLVSARWKSVTVLSPERLRALAVPG